MRWPYVKEYLDRIFTSRDAIQIPDGCLSSFQAPYYMVGTFGIPSHINNSNEPFADFLSLEKLSRGKSIGWEVGDTDFLSFHKICLSLRKNTSFSWIQSFQLQMREKEEYGIDLDSALDKSTPKLWCLG